MASDAPTRNLIRCDFCPAEAHLVGVDEKYHCFECDASPANHEWSNLRDPACARCQSHLSEHRWLWSKDCGNYFICPEFLEDNTFVWPE
jgi:hypothetical protein